MHPKTLTHCRVCGNRVLESSIDLGVQYLQGSFLKEGVRRPPMRKLPLHLVRCDVAAGGDACGLLQLAHSFPAEILYANYWYRSGINATMRAHLAEIAGQAMDMAGCRPGEKRTIVDIGCNDGTLLRSYPEEYVKYGVDPSDIARGIETFATLVNSTFPGPAAEAALPAGGVDIVTSIAMFYDLDDPVGFARSVRDLLAPGGIWVLEMSYMPLMLARNSFDTICHEHLEYYSLDVIEQIMEKAGLTVYRASLNEINGGSIRVFCGRGDGVRSPDPADRDFLRWLGVLEFELELDTGEPYAAFGRRIETLREKTLGLLTDLKAKGKRIHVYGASTKGNVLLQWYGLNHLWIDAAADRNPDKDGATTLGTGIPIVSEEKSRAMRPDHYLVLPWHFIGEFLQRERDTIMGGVGMIFPLPELRRVDKDNVDAVIDELGRSGGGASARKSLEELVGWG